MFYNINKIVVGIGMVTLLALLAIQIPGANADTKTDFRSKFQSWIPVPTADYLRERIRPDHDGFDFKVPNNDQEVWEVGRPQKDCGPINNLGGVTCNILWCSADGHDVEICTDTGVDICYDHYYNQIPCN